MFNRGIACCWLALVLLLVSLQQGQVEAGDISVQFDDGATEECARVMFIWHTRYDPETLEKTMEDVCRRINSSDLPGQKCKVQFGAHAAMPSITTELTGCCEGATSKLVMENFPGISMCRNIPSTLRKKPMP
mmetsp:Transcript_74/g.229  ORF Transcript_74/g.229 Transcript_74/m.229 type:complete len:132 (-) Transcript_74:105-500(-)